MKIINNTNQVRHLPNGGTLQPGDNDLNKKIIKANLGHPIIENDIERNRLVIPSIDELREEQKDQPKEEKEEKEEENKDEEGKLTMDDLTNKSSHYYTPNGEYIGQGEEKAKEWLEKKNEEGE